MANLPNQADRAGIFEPPKSFWDRFFSKKDKRDNILFPPDSDLKATPKSPLKFDDLSAPLPISPPGGFLKKSRTQSRKRHLQHPSSRKRKPVKFGAIDQLSSSDEEEDDLKVSPLTPPPLSYSSSTPTLVDEPPKALQKKPTTEDPVKPLVIDYDAELAELKKLKGTNIEGTPDYSDHEEEDLTSISQRHQSEDHNQWSPAFMKRHSSGLSVDAGGITSIPLPGAAPVPATPSLIKALDRIAVAQREAFGHTAVPSASTPAAASGGKGVKKNSPSERHIAKLTPRREEPEEEDNARAVERARKERAPRWEEFWREVRVKAHT